MFWLFPALLAAFAEGTTDFVSKRAMKIVNPYVAAWALPTFTLPFLALALAYNGIPELGPLYFPAVFATVPVWTVANILYMKAIKASDLSLTLPMVSFTPVFMLLTGPLVVNEFPSAMGIAGVVAVVIGAYALSIKDVKKGVFQPFISLAKEMGPRYMLVVAFLFSITAVTVKLAVNESGPILGIGGPYFFSALLFTVYVFLTKKATIAEVRDNWKALLAIGFFKAISSIALMYAYTLTLAIFAVSVKRLSSIVGSLYGFKFFKEKDIAQRMIGAFIMLLGVFIIAFS